MTETATAGQALDIKTEGQFRWGEKIEKWTTVEPHQARTDFLLLAPEFPVPERWFIPIEGGVTKVQRRFPTPIEYHTLDQIMSLRIKQRWFDEGAVPPSPKSRMMSYQVFETLLGSYGKIPDSIDASIEGGITLTYRNFQNERRMIVEVSNGQEIAAVVTDGVGILDSAEIGEFQFSSLIAIFREENWVETTQDSRPSKTPPERVRSGS